jgi:hypothetical protein
VWINISAIQMFQGELETALSAGLARHGIEPAQLGLELTESVLLDERAGDIVPRLEALRVKGHRIAIDDFGMGYSSLSYLKNLPLDKLKLDRAFIRSLPDDPADAAIVSAVLAMARGLEAGAWWPRGWKPRASSTSCSRPAVDWCRATSMPARVPPEAIEAQWQASTSSASVGAGPASRALRCMTDQGQRDRRHFRRPCSRLGQQQLHASADRALGEAAFAVAQVPLPHAHEAFVVAQLAHRVEAR